MLEQKQHIVVSPTSNKARNVICACEVQILVWSYSWLNVSFYSLKWKGQKKNWCTIFQKARNQLRTGDLFLFSTKPQLFQKLLRCKTLVSVQVNAISDLASKTLLENEPQSISATRLSSLCCKQKRTTLVFRYLFGDHARIINCIKGMGIAGFGGGFERSGWGAVVLSVGKVNRSCVHLDICPWGIHHFKPSRSLLF